MPEKVEQARSQAGVPQGKRAAWVPEEAQKGQAVPNTASEAALQLIARSSGTQRGLRLAQGNTERLLDTALKRSLVFAL